ncbi:MAG TPA: PBP1A family penicillin-binding protein [Bryobacteraceae bacterium]|nr:PBP1A family penicillin-binding protein [Bryobacteraceae bacterium]
MAVKVHVPRKARLVRFFLHSWGKLLIALAVIALATGAAVFTYYYNRYARLVDAKLRSGPYTSTSMLFAAPKLVMLGDEGSPAEIAAYLRECNYGDARQASMGSYNLRPDAIEIFPGPESYFRQEPEVIKFSRGKVSQIISLRDNSEGTEYYLEPELITNLFDRKREKRRIVHFGDIPPIMKDAVLAAEDKRFFQHSGFDPIGILRAMLVDLKERRNAAGASTLTQQLARSVFLTQDRTWRRKIAEALMTMHLEKKLSKRQIFEYYANEIYLGRRGSFSIHGFGEAAEEYFGKDLTQITDPDEAALLAGIAQGPSLYNPFRSPDRAKGRRNTVLGMMREDGFLTQAQYEHAIAAPLEIVSESAESSAAPYFVDLVNDTLQSRFQDRDFQANSYRVYTTLDMDLQRDASAAVQVGMEEVDKQLKRRYKTYGITMPLAQCALIAMDPHTGEVKAVVGGRNYGMSQLNRVLAKRQPGSVFKPFVYTAAINTALGDNPTVFTPITNLVDEPTTFWYDNKPYEPNNFESKFYGNVTVKEALAKSLNVPTVKLAEAVGYDKVVQLARSAGMNIDIRPTPAVALGAYDVTPIEIAGAYTIFANGGIYTKPIYLERIVDQHGSSIYQSEPEHKTVLDPRVAYMMVDMMEEVLRSGTGAGVRARGFTLPAAGKTGTSHDGWFAGFTSKLLCIVWVGFDDNRVLKLDGARSALPIWTEFMKRAQRHREYRNVSPFTPPDGIVTADIDPTTGQLATPACPQHDTDVFIAGTQPVDVCRLHGGGATQVAGWAPTQPSGNTPASPSPTTSPDYHNRQQVQSIPISPEPVPPQQPKKQHKGFFGRIRDIFK